MRLTIRLAYSHTSRLMGHCDFDNVNDFILEGYLIYT